MSREENCLAVFADWKTVEDLENFPIIILIWAFYLLIIWSNCILTFDASMAVFRTTEALYLNMLSPLYTRSGWWKVESGFQKVFPKHWEQWLQFLRQIQKLQENSVLSTIAVYFALLIQVFRGGGLISHSLKSIFHNIRGR